MTLFNKKIALSIALFFIIFSSLGLFYGTWGMGNDDWGNIRHAIAVTKWQDCARYFINIELVNHGEFPDPTAISPNRQAFFVGLLRPMSFVYYFLEYHIFGLSPYAFFLVSALFHTLSCIILFFIFSMITSLFWAFATALFFGFHPSLWLWWGWISAQSYFIQLCFLLFIFLCLRQFLHTSRWHWYILACLLYAHNLLLHEQTIILSFWLIPALYFYHRHVLKKPRAFWKNIQQSLTYASGFLVVTCSYIGLRLWLFPLTSRTDTLTFQPNLSSFIHRFSQRFFDFVTQISDLFSLTALPHNSTVIKCCAIAGIAGVLTHLFIYNKYKKLIIFFALSTLFFSWPALLMHHQPRYTYLSFPFFIFMVLLLFRFYQGKKLHFFKLMPKALFLALIGLNAVFITKSTLQSQQWYVASFHAFSELMHNPATHHASINFINLPSFFAVGTTQAVWLMGNDITTKISQHHGIDYTTLPHSTNTLNVAWNSTKQRFIILRGNL